MEILVTGATSIIGVPLIKELLTEGHTVNAIVRPYSSNFNRIRKICDSSKLNIISLDLSEIYKLPDLLLNGCDICFHFAWDGAGSENRKLRSIQQKNVVDSFELFRTVSLLGCKKFIFSGSQAEYGVYRQKIREDADCNPISEYGKAKVDFMNLAKDWLFQEYQCGNTTMQYIHTRIFSVYGPEEHKGSLLESCISAFSKDESISLSSCSQLWNYMYIDDLIRAFISLMKVEIPSLFEIYNLAGAENETMYLYQYVEKIHQIMQYHGSYKLGARAQNAEGETNLNPDISKIQQHTNWYPRISFEIGIQKIIEQWRIKYVHK